MQRATLLRNRAISDQALSPLGLTRAGADAESQDKTSLARRRWSSQQDAPSRECKGLNPEVKVLSLTKRTFPPAFSSQAPHRHAAHTYDSLVPSSPSFLSMLPEPNTAGAGNLFSSSALARHPSRRTAARTLTRLRGLGWPLRALGEGARGNASRSSARGRTRRRKRSGQGQRLVEETDVNADAMLLAANVRVWEAST